MSSEDQKSIEKIISGLDTEFLTDHPMCEYCLGRLLAKIGTGIPNEVRGAEVRTHTQLTQIEPEDCWLCDGISGQWSRYASLVTTKLSDWEYATYLVGSKFDPEIIEKEETLWTEVSGEHSEPIKAEFNREVGKLVYDMTAKEVSFDKPDIVTVVDTMYDSIDLQVSPLFIYGRYRKLVRGIPQTRWPCRKCLGKGCERCSNTGKMYQTSVEEIIGREVMKHSEGIDHKFHGMGREDVDALMLGTGRPFVLEIKWPVKRNLPFDEIESSINNSGEGVEVSDLRLSDGKEVIRVKSARPEKKYRVSVSFRGQIDEEKLKEVVSSLGGKTIAQKTPNRVKHRRADKTRARVVKTLELVSYADELATLELVAEAGTYVKEFVHGDEGRTTPSIAEALGVVCKVEKLNVLEIRDKA